MDSVVITIYPPCDRRNSSGETYAGDWDAVAEWIGDIEDTAAKHEASLWSPIDIRETGDRRSSTVLSFWPCEFDEMSPDEFERVLRVCEQLDCVVYTTASSTDERPRCRIAARSTRPIRRDEQSSCVRYFEAACSVRAPREAHTASQAWYRPIRGAQVWRFSGDALDVDEAIADYPPKKRGQKPRLSQDEIDSVDLEARIQLAREKLADYTGESTFFAACIVVRDFAVPPIHALPLVRRWCHRQDWDDIPDDDEILEKLENAEQYGSEEVGSGLVPARAWTDAGNAERVIDRFGDELRYVENIGWYVWDGEVWCQVNPTWQAIATARNTAQYAHKIEDPELQSFAVKSESAKAIRDALGIAKDHPDVRIDVNELDADPWMLNVRNGEIDLRTGMLREHDRNSMSTKLCPTTYDQEAKCDRFEQFMHEVFDDDGVVEFMHRFLGYCITGDVSEHVMSLWWGTGRNGKSTLIETMKAILGPYAGMMAPGMLLSSDKTRHSTERVDLRGLRFAFESEIDEGRLWNEALLKRLTGGDSIKGRRLRQESVEFRPTHKIVMSANSKPLTRSSGLAFWKRMILVPFTQSFAGREDRGLPKRIEGEAPGILAWLVRGCIKWQTGGLMLPKTIEVATNEYRQEMDIIGQFVESEVDTTKENARIPRPELYRVFKEWSEDEGVKFTRNAFYRMMREHGYQSVKTNGRDVYIGLCIRRRG